MAVYDDFMAGNGEISPGFTLSSVGGKHLLEKNAAILLGPPLLFSASSTRHLILKKKQIYQDRSGDLDREDSKPGLTGKPSLIKTSFFTWTKIISHIQLN